MSRTINALRIAHKAAAGPVAPAPAAPAPTAPAPGALDIPDWTPGETPAPPTPTQPFSNWPFGGPPIRGRPAPPAPAQPVQAPTPPTPQRYWDPKAKQWFWNMPKGHNWTQEAPAPRKGAMGKPAQSVEEQWRDFVKKLPQSEKGHLPKMEGKVLVQALELAKRAAREGKLRPDQVEALKSLLADPHKPLGQRLRIDPDEWEKSHDINRALRGDPVFRYEQNAAGGGGFWERNLRGMMGDRLYDTAERTARNYRPANLDWTSAVPAVGWLKTIQADQARGNPMRDSIRDALGIAGNHSAATPVTGVAEQSGGALPLSGAPGAGAAEAAYQGPIHSHVPGRTDRIRLDVKPGSYVLPADIVSIAGEGNTAAGNNIFKLMFAGPPVRGRPMRGAPGAPGLDLRGPIMKHAKGTKGTGHAEGGEAEDGEDQENENVPIIAAGGEIVIPPEAIVAKFGDMDRGHQILDKLVLRMRGEEIKRLKTTPPPKR